MDARLVVDVAGARARVWVAVEVWVVDGAIAAWGWLALRLFGILRVQALWRVAIGRGWSWIAAGLGVLLAAVWSVPVSPVEWTTWLWLGAWEVVLGVVIGLVVGLPGEALIGAARQTGACLGLVGLRGWVTLQAALAGSLGLALGAHHGLLTGLRGAATRWELGVPAAWGAPLELDACVDLARELLLLGFGLATPVMLAALVADLVLAGSSRARLLQVTLGALRPWVILWFGLGAMASAWESYPEAFLRSFGRT